jgi:hypothetical protein
MPDLSDPWTRAARRGRTARVACVGLALVRVVSALGAPWGLVLVPGLARLLAGRRTAHRVLGGVAHEVPLWLALTYLIGIERPASAGLTAHEDIDMPAFPSGHVALCTVMLGEIVVWPRTWPLAALVVLAVGVVGAAPALAVIALPEGDLLRAHRGSGRRPHRRLAPCRRAVARAPVARAVSGAWAFCRRSRCLAEPIDLSFSRVPGDRATLPP